MPQLRTTERFDAWLRGLRDIRARARIQARLDRLGLGNPGDVRPVGDGISELRIDYGPGYRVNYTRTEEVVLLLLCGGDKRSQARDIETARALIKQLKE